MDRTDRELASLYRLRARQAPSGPLRDIGDPLDYLAFVRLQAAGRIAAERDYRQFRVSTPLKIIPKRSEPAARRSPSVPLRSRSSPSDATKVMVPRQGESLFPPVDPRARIEIDGNTVRIYEPDGVRHMVAADYWRQVREQRHA